MPYNLSQSTLLLPNQTCIEENFAALDDGFSLGHEGNEIEMPSVDLETVHPGPIPICKTIILKGNPTKFMNIYKHQ